MVIEERFQNAGPKLNEKAVENLPIDSKLERRGFLKFKKRQNSSLSESPVL
jgi:hypothetical protein